MKKAKFLQDVKLDPARFYRNPSDVMRDRRLTDEDRRQIFAAWERNAQSAEQSDSFDAAANAQIEKLRQLRQQLDHDVAATDAGVQSEEATGAGLP
jgi:hypothetical protein